MTKVERAINQWNHWLVHFLGQQLLSLEQKSFANLLAKCMVAGQYSVLVGVPHQSPLLHASNLPTSAIMSPLIDKSYRHTMIESNLLSLPALPGSIDLVMLPHTLEYVKRPHRLLREACSIIRPEGVIAICGFNPFSLWGLQKALAGKQQMPWAGQFISKSRVRRWLLKLGFQILLDEFILYIPPVTQAKTYHRLAFMEWIGTKCHLPLGGVYIIVARAKQIPVTPLRNQWSEQLAATSLVGSPNPSIRYKRDI